MREKHTLHQVVTQMAHVQLGEVILYRNTQMNDYLFFVRFLPQELWGAPHCHAVCSDRLGEVLSDQ